MEKNNNPKEKFSSQQSKPSNLYQERFVLPSWAKKKKEVIVYSNTGAKVQGQLVAVDTYSITLLNGVDNKVIVFKSNIFYVERFK